MTLDHFFFPLNWTTWRRKWLDSNNTAFPIATHYSSWRKQSVAVCWWICVVKGRASLTFHWLSLIHIFQRYKWECGVCFLSDIPNHRDDCLWLRVMHLCDGILMSGIHWKGEKARSPLHNTVRPKKWEKIRDKYTNFYDTTICHFISLHNTSRISTCWPWLCHPSWKYATSIGNHSLQTE